MVPAHPRCPECREKLAGLEAKHRSMLQDKNNLGLEKATMERELKVLRGQAAKFKQVSVGFATRSMAFAGFE